MAMTKLELLADLSKNELAQVLKKLNGGSVGFDHTRKPIEDVRNHIIAMWNHDQIADALNYLGIMPIEKEQEIDHPEYLDDTGTFYTERDNRYIYRRIPESKAGFKYTLTFAAGWTSGSVSWKPHVEWLLVGRDGTRWTFPCEDADRRRYHDEIEYQVKIEEEGYKKSITEEKPMEPEAVTQQPEVDALTKAIRDAVQGTLTKSTGLDAEAINKIVDERIEAQQPKIVYVVEKTGKKVEVGAAHKALDEVVKLASIKTASGFRPCIYLCGPTGSGKTHLAEQAATVLGLQFGAISLFGGISESALLGHLIPSGDSGKFEYHQSEFVRIYSEGGVFLLDELDSTDANTTLLLNAALSNGGFSVPQRLGNKFVKRHPDFLCIGAGNTWMSGATAGFAGRDKQDGALIDRFVANLVYVDYCSKLEKLLVMSEVLTWAKSVRASMKTNAINHRPLSTRTLMSMSAQIASGFDLDTRVKAFFLNWSDSEKQKVGH